MESKTKNNSVKSNDTPGKLSNILSDEKYNKSYISYALAEREKEKKRRKGKIKERKKEKHKEKKTDTDKEKRNEKCNGKIEEKNKKKTAKSYKEKITYNSNEIPLENHKDKQREKSKERGQEKDKQTKKERDKSEEDRVNVPRKGKKQTINDETVEKQLKKLVEHLYSLKFKLEKDKKKEKQDTRNLISTTCLKRSKSANPLGNEAIGKEHIDDNPTVNFTDKKCVLKNIDRTSSIASHIPELIKTVEIYKNRNVEEKRNNRCIINKYEGMIRNIKKQHINEINEIKNTILEDVDFLIQKYRNVALELLEITKRKEKKNEVEKKKITEICISACKKFEEDVKQKAKASLQDYKTYMIQQNESIKREKEFLQKKLNDMKKHMEEEKHFIEKQVFESCGKKLKDEVAMNKKLKKQLIFERQQHNVLIGSLYSKIDEQIKVYEENFVKIAHEILAKNNVTMSIYELQNLIKTAMDKQYQKDQLEMEQKRKELENSKMNVKYGFTTVYNK